MRSLASYLTNLIAPSAGFSEGQLKDNPGDNSGTGIVAQTHNDFLYGFLAVINRFSDVSDTSESETASDFLNALNWATSNGHPDVTEYDNAATYNLNAQVYYENMQWVSLAGSNTGNDPLTSPTWWLPVRMAKEVFFDWKTGVIKRGGMDPVHDDAGGSYQQWLKYGIHRIGSSAGDNDYQAYIVHLDGSVLTGDTDLETIFAPGGGNEYRFIDTIAPDSMGTRTLVDYSATATGEAAEGCPYVIVMLPV